MWSLIDPIFSLYEYLIVRNTVFIKSFNKQFKHQKLYPILIKLSLAEVLIAYSLRLL